MEPPSIRYIRMKAANRRAAAHPGVTYDPGDLPTIEALLEYIDASEPRTEQTVREAAALLGVTPHTLRQQIANGKLKARKVGRDWSVTPREVERYRAESLGSRHSLTDEEIIERSGVKFTRNAWVRRPHRPAGSKRS